MSATLQTDPQDDDKASLFSLDTLETTKEEEVKPLYLEHEPRRLYVPRDYASGILRASSPDGFSEMSIEDRPSVHLHGPQHEQASKSPVRPKGLKGSILTFWDGNKGLCYVLLAQVFGTLMNVTTRLLELEGNDGKGIHPFQILFARMGITVVLASLYMWWKGTPHFPFGAREVRPLLVARGLTGFFGVFGMYYSLVYLPLADATVITFLAPGIACWACSYILKEPFTKMEQIAALVSLFGVVLIARPTSLFPGHETAPLANGEIDGLPSALNETATDRFSLDHVTPQERLIAVGVAMLGVLGAAGAYTTIRWIGTRAHPLISVNYFATWCTIVSTIMMFALPGVGFLLPANLKEWSLLFFLGISGFIFQFLLAAGLQAEKSSRATNMVYTQMLFALGFDKVVFGTTPALLSIIGSSLILGSAIYVAVQKETVKSKEAPERNMAVILTGEEELGLVDGMEMNDIDDNEEGHISDNEDDEESRR